MVLNQGNDIGHSLRPSAYDTATDKGHERKKGCLCAWEVTLLVLVLDVCGHVVLQPDCVHDESVSPHEPDLAPSYPPGFQPALTYPH